MKSHVFLLLTIFFTSAQSLWAQPPDYNGRNYKVVDRDGSRAYIRQNVVQQIWNNVTNKPMYEDRRTNQPYAGGSSGGSYSSGYSGGSTEGVYSKHRLLKDGLYIATRYWNYPPSTYIRDGLLPENLLGFYSASELKADKKFKLAGVDNKDKNAAAYFLSGFSIKELKAAGFDLSSFVVTPGDNIKIKIANEESANSQNLKCTIVRASFSYSKFGMHDSKKGAWAFDGTLSEAIIRLTQRDPVCSVLISEKDLKEAGFNAGEILEKGGSVAALRKLGFSSGKMLAEGVSPTELKSSDSSILLDDEAALLGADELKKKGFSVSEILDCKADHLTLQLLNQANISAIEVYSTGKVTSSQLLDAGYNASEVIRAIAPTVESQWALLASVLASDELGLTPVDVLDELREKNISVSEIRSHNNISITLFKRSGFTDADIAAGYQPLSQENISELLSNHVNLQDIKNSGATLDEVHATHLVQWKDLQPVFSEQLVSMSKLMSASDFSSKYSSSGSEMLRLSLYSALELYHSNLISTDEVLAAYHSSGISLYEAGFKLSEILSFKLNIADIKSSFQSSGKTIILVSELKALSLEALDLLDYFDNEELVSGGYALNEVRAARMKRALQSKSKAKQ